MIKKINMIKYPDPRVDSKGNPLPIQHATRENVEELLRQINVTVRWNMMTGKPDYFIPKFNGPEEAAERYVLDYATRGGMGNKHRDVLDIIVNAIAPRNRYHPMADMLKSLPPAAGDPIGDLIASVKTDDPLWPTYVENWLIQVVDAVCGWENRKGPYSLPYVLVLVGGQGLGKTRWFANLGGEFMKTEAELHLNGSGESKDHKFVALRFPMVELAELETVTKRAEVGALKAFISSPEDELRAVYGRRATVRPRVTVFCGSVNEAEFLNDSTGSRRFWPVVVDSIDWNYTVDFEGIWSQAYALWQQNPDFNLTPEEEAMRSVSAEMHRLLSVEEETIVEYYRRHSGNTRYPDVPMNRTEILKMLFGNIRPSPIQISETGKVLGKLLGKHRTLEGKKRAWMFPYNEFAQDRSAWAGKSHVAPT